MLPVGEADEAGPTRLVDMSEWREHYEDDEEIHEMSRVLELKNLRAVKAALQRSEEGHGGHVMAQIMGITMNYDARIDQAKTRQGSLYVRRMDNGQWYAPLSVWQVK